MAACSPIPLCSSHLLSRIAGQPATVQPDGRWALHFFAILLPGDQTFSGRVIEDDGSLVGERLFTVTIPAPPSLVIESGLTDVDDILLRGKARPDRQVTLTINGEALVTLQADNQGFWQYTTRLQPGEYEFLALDGLLESERGELTVALAVPAILGQPTDESGQLIPGFYGLGRPDTRLEILHEDMPVGQAAVDTDGNWRCKCTLPPGEQTVSVREIDEPHRASRTTPMQVLNPSPPSKPGPADPDVPPFSCPEGSPTGEIKDNIYVIGCGESMNFITYRLGVTPEQLLAYNPQLSDPPRFYFGQIINIPQTASCFDDSD